MEEFGEQKEELEMTRVTCHCVTVYRSVLQCVAVCCSVLREGRIGK